MANNKVSIPSSSEKQSYKFLLDAALARKREQEERAAEEQRRLAAEENREEEKFAESLDETQDEADYEDEEADVEPEDEDEDEDVEESDEDFDDESEEEDEEESDEDESDESHDEAEDEDDEEEEVESEEEPQIHAPARQEEMDLTPAESAEDETEEEKPAGPISVPEGKNYFRIGEVAELLRVEPHVLRYWESEFSQIRPTKSGGQRVYNRKTVESLVEIRRLLYDQGFSIHGARKQLKEFRGPKKQEAPVQVVGMPREELVALEKGLRELIRYAESNTAF